MDAGLQQPCWDPLRQVPREIHLPEPETPLPFRTVLVTDLVVKRCCCCPAEGAQASPYVIRAIPGRGGTPAADETPCFRARRAQIFPSAGGQRDPARLVFPKLE